MNGTKAFAEAGKLYAATESLEPRDAMERLEVEATGAQFERSALRDRAWQGCNVRAGKHRFQSENSLTNGFRRVHSLACHAKRGEIEAEPPTSSDWRNSNGS